VNLTDAGDFNGYGLYVGLRLDYRLRMWAPTSTSRTISAVAELLVTKLIKLWDYIKSASNSIYKLQHLHTVFCNIHIQSIKASQLC